MARCIILAVVVLLAAQSGRGALIDSALDALRNQTQSIIDEVQDAVEKITDKLQELADAAIDDIKKRAQEFGQELQKDVDKLQQTAEATVDGAEKCFIGTPESIAQLVQNITTEAIACVTDPIKKGAEIVETLFSLAQQANATYAQATVDYDACQSKSILERPICTVKVVGQASITEAKIVAQVTSEVSEGESLIANFKANLDKCELGVWTSAPTRASATILAGIKACLGISS